MPIGPNLSAFRRDRQPLPRPATVVKGKRATSAAEDLGSLILGVEGFAHCRQIFPTRACRFMSAIMSQIRLAAACVTAINLPGVVIERQGSAAVRAMVEKIVRRLCRALVAILRQARNNSVSPPPAGAIRIDSSGHRAGRRHGHIPVAPRSTSAGARQSAARPREQSPRLMSPQEIVLIDLDQMSTLAFPGQQIAFDNLLNPHDPRRQVTGGEHAVEFDDTGIRSVADVSQQPQRRSVDSGKRREANSSASSGEVLIDCHLMPSSRTVTWRSSRSPDIGVSFREGQRFRNYSRSFPVGLPRP